LLKFAMAMALVFAVFLLLLWYTQPWRPVMTLAQALCAMFVPSLLLVASALSRLQDWHGYWRWPAVFFLCWAVAWFPPDDPTILVPDDPPAHSWWWTGISLVVAAALRDQARRRWLVLDMPRAAA
jgi:hypothetical protein